MLQLLVGAH